MLPVVASQFLPYKKSVSLQRPKPNKSLIKTNAELLNKQELQIKKAKEKTKIPPKIQTTAIFS